MTKEENEESLRDAATRGDISIVRELLGRGTDLNAADMVRFVELIL